MSASYRAAFREWFGITSAQANVLVALYQAHGDVVSNRSLADAAGIVVKAVNVQVYQLRTALDPEAIECERGHGYRLTPGGLSECLAVLWKIGDELRRAS